MDCSGHQSYKNENTETKDLKNIGKNIILKVRNGLLDLSETELEKILGESFFINELLCL